MEVVITVLMCALGVFMYLTNKNNREILKRNEEIRTLNQILAQRDEEIFRLKNQIALILPSPQSTRQQMPRPEIPPTLGKKFIQVIFKKHGKKRYDYLLGNNPDVQINDFVVVPVADRLTGEIVRKIAKVIYVSQANEISAYANSPIFGKINNYSW
ncbi:MAG: hypothetical protein K6G55_09090 [Selenomonadaceae bacterium]|nr:hypothetical protein [Selenomonadaceae bacterium]